MFFTSELQKKQYYFLKKVCNYKIGAIKKLFLTLTI